MKFSSSTGDVTVTRQAASAQAADGAAEAIEGEAAALVRAYGERSVRIAEQKAIAAEYFNRQDLRQRWLRVAASAARLLSSGSPLGA